MTNYQQRTGMRPNKAIRDLAGIHRLVEEFLSELAMLDALPEALIAAVESEVEQAEAALETAVALLDAHSGYSDRCGCAKRAERRMTSPGFGFIATSWLQNFEEFWAESEEAEHTDAGRANELLKAAAVVLENELKGWPG